MKKSLLSLSFLLFISIWYADAQITTYPYVEDFESGDGGWIVDNTTAGTWALGTPANTIINSADSGSNAWATNLTGDYNTDENSTVTSPEFNLSSLVSPSIQMSIWYNSEFSWDGMVLQSSIDDGTSWQNVGAQGDPNNWYNDNSIAGEPGGQQVGWTGRGTSGTGGWVIARHALNGLGGEASVLLRIAFGSDGSVQDEGVAFDTVSIFEVSCPEPSGVSVDNITENSTDVNWIAGGAEDTWEIVAQTAGTGIPTGSGTTISNNPYNFNMLNPSTAYEIYIRSVCSTTEFSNWVGPINFTTLNTPPPPPLGVACASGSSSFIFAEDFEIDPPSGWTGTGFDGSNGNWDITNANANSIGTGPENAYDGGSGMHLEYESGGSATDIASAISPAIDLTAAIDGAELSFFMHAFGEDIGTLNVGISNDATGPFTSVFTWVGDLQVTDDENWVPIGINIDSYLGQVIYIEFSYSGAGTGFEGDMAIDFIRVESCGSFCIPPNGIIASNITGTSADISWTANNGETSWEYVLVPAGTGEPSGPGTTVTVPSVSISDLDFETEYEVWVRADCGTEFSIWSGPSNFTTTIQVIFDVDCAVGPTNSFICYGNGDSEIFTYTSSDGSPLNLTINVGEIEGAPFDFLLVTDGNGTVLYNDEGNDGVLDGLTFQSITDTITIQVTSDGSVSCQSGSGCCLDGIDFTVACATCINPVATYQVIDDCDNGDQFLIDVNVTSLGDATSLTISNNINGDTVPITAIGVYQIGPFPFLVDVIVSVNNDQDVNCQINSSPIQLLACPPENDNPCNATVAVVNNDESCDLVTTGTLIEATDSGVPTGSCTGNPNDDVWFEFTALGEQQIISLLNINGGSFNIDHAVYEGVCDNLTELYCSDDDTSVTPTLTIGNTYYVRVFSGGNNSTTTTFDLCINTLGPPIFCLDALPICALDLEYPSVTGDDVAPPYIDYDCLGQQPDPTWNAIYFDLPGDYTFTLAQTGLDGVGNDIDFIVWGPFTDQQDGCVELLPENIADCSYSAVSIETITLNNVQAGDIFIILITNFSQEDGVFTFTQATGPENGTNCEIVCDAEVLYQNIEVQEDLNNLGFSEPIELCGEDSIDLVASSPYGDNYQWYFQNGIPIEGATNETLTVTESGDYFVEVSGEVCDGFSYSIQVIVILGDEAIANPVDDIITCDDASADEVEEFDLSIQTSGILGTQSEADFNVTYHLTLSDATNDLNPLPLIYTNISNPQTIFVRIESISAEACQGITSFDLIISGPTPTATSVPLEVCDDDTDGIVDFDLASHSINILNGQSDTDFTVSYYSSEVNAETATSSLALLYTSTSQTIWARVESNIAFDCYSVVPIDLIVKPLPSTSFSSEIDYEVCPDATVPILITATANNYSETNVTIVWYLDGNEIAEENSLELPVTEAGIYEIEVIYNDATQCSSITEREVIELDTCVFPEGISPNGDGRNDRFDLSSYDVSKLEIFNRNGILVYSKTNYKDEWFGQTNDGNELPVGTYFYTMEYRDGRRSAWVYIQRLN